MLGPAMKVSIIDNVPQNVRRRESNPPVGLSPAHSRVAEDK